MAQLIFSTLGANVNPVEPPATWAKIAVCDPALTVSGSWNLASGTQVVWVHDTVITNNMEVSCVVASINSNSRGPALTSLAGNGYLVLVRNTDIRLFLLNAGVLGSLLGTITMAISSGSKIALRPNLTTGLIQILVNDVQVGEFTNTTHMDKVLQGGPMSRGGLLTSVEVVSLVAVPTVSDVNTTNTVTLGSVDNELTVSDFVDPLTSVTIGGREVENLISVGSGVYTFDDQFFTDGDTTDPGFGTLDLIASNATEEAGPLAITRELPAGWSEVVYSTLSSDESSLAERIEGAVIETGDTHYFEDADITIYDDSTFENAPSGSITTWLRKASTNELILVYIINGVPFLSLARNVSMGIGIGLSLV